MSVFLDHLYPFRWERYHVSDLVKDPDTGHGCYAVVFGSMGLRLLPRNLGRAKRFVCRPGKTKEQVRAEACAWADEQNERLRREDEALAQRLGVRV